MVEFDEEELKKMSPEERLKALKKLEEKGKEEIEAARKLMAESEREIEVKEEHKRDMPIPQLAAVDVDSLFSSEEKQIFRTKRYTQNKKEESESEDEGIAEKASEEPQEDEAADDHSQGNQSAGVLEERVHKENPPALSQEEAHQYGARLEMMQDRVYQLQEMKYEEPDRFSKYESDYLEELKEIKKEWEGIHEKYKTAGQEVAEEASISTQIDKMLGWYRR
ncbi:MAG: hypothetical protein R6U32_00210 [Candidatus Woesearchaeota archaeon]